MPLLTLSTWPALTQPEQRHAIARELTGHTERLLGKKRALTAVAVLAEPIGWTIGGEPIRVSQALSLVMVLVSAFMLLYNIKLHPHKPEELYVNIAAAQKAAEGESADGSAE